jgi:amino acid transporter
MEIAGYVAHAMAGIPLSDVLLLIVIAILGVLITSFDALSDIVSNTDQFPIHRSAPASFGSFPVTILPLILSLAVQLYSYDHPGEVAHISEKLSDIPKVVLIITVSSDHTIRITLHIVLSASVTRICSLDSTAFHVLSIIVTIIVYIPGRVYICDWNSDPLDHEDRLSFVPSQKSHT